MISLLALLSSGYLISTNTMSKDSIAILIAPHFPVLISQNILIIVLATQVLSMRSIYPLVGIRSQTAQVQTHILKLLLVEIACYFVCYYAPFFLSTAPAFHDGDTFIGSSILLYRFIILCLTAVLLLGLYHVQKPYILVCLALLLQMLYHFIVEFNLLLIQYAPIYDPIYRMMHAY